MKTRFTILLLSGLLLWAGEAGAQSPLPYTSRTALELGYAFGEAGDTLRLPLRLYTEFAATVVAFSFNLPAASQPYLELVGIEATESCADCALWQGVDQFLDGRLTHPVGTTFSWGDTIAWLNVRVLNDLPGWTPINLAVFNFEEVGAPLIRADALWLSGGVARYAGQLPPAALRFSAFAIEKVYSCSDHQPLQLTYATELPGIAVKRKAGSGSSSGWIPFEQPYSDTGNNYTSPSGKTLEIALEYESFSRAGGVRYNPWYFKAWMPSGFGLDDCATPEPDGHAGVSLTLFSTHTTFTWSNGETAQTAVALAAGQHQVIVRDTLLGCEVQLETSTESLLAQGRLYVLPAYYECFGLQPASLQVRAQGAVNLDEFDYQWSTGDTTQLITMLSDGEYSVTVSAGEGCVDVLTGVVIKQVNMTLPHSSTIDCTETTLDSLWITQRALLPSSNMLSPNLQYEWSTGATTNFITNLPLGQHALTITNPDLGCSHVYTALVRHPDPITVHTQYGTCLFNEQGQKLYRLNIHHAQPPLNIEQSNGDFFTTPDNVVNVWVNPNDTLVVNVTDSRGCTAQASFLNDCPDAPPATPASLLFTTDLSYSAPYYPATVDEPFDMGLYAANFIQLTAFSFYTSWSSPGNIAIDTIIWHPLIADGVQWVSAGPDRVDYRWTNPTGVSLLPTEPLAVVRLRVLEEAAGRLNIGHRIHGVQNSQGQAVGGAQIQRPFQITDNDHCALHFPPVEVSSTNIFHVPLIVDRFEALFGLQFSMAYDTSLLELTNAELLIESAADTDFGTSRPGQVTFSWTDPLLTGFSLQPGDTLLMLSFRARRTGSAELAITNYPTAIEAINSLDQLVPIHSLPAATTVMPGAYVYPGDMDANGVVNHFDLLSLGLAAGNSQPGGAPRADASTAWAAQPALAWQAHTPASHINLAHADADGDGAPTPADALWVAQHYGQQNEHSTGDPMAHTDLPVAPMSIHPPLYVRADSLYPETELAAFDLVLGEASAPASDVYGLAFSIYYQPERIAPGSMSATFEQSWLNGAGALTFVRDHPELGRIDIAITRTDGQTATGAGVIGQLRFAPQLSASDETEALHFRPDHVMYINAAEHQMPVDALATSAPVAGGAVTASAPEPEAGAAIRVYPNPTADQVFIHADGRPITSVTCWNADGRLVRRFGIGTTAADLSGLPAGTYTLKIQGADGWVASSTVMKH